MLCFSLGSRVRGNDGGACGNDGGACGNDGCPAPPWALTSDPLLVSPWEGEGWATVVALMVGVWVWVEMACFVFLWVPASAGMT